MRTFGYLICMFLAVGALHAEIYKWTDSEGNVHFSDQPHQGSEQINLPASQTFTPPAQNNSAPPPAKTQGSDAERGYKVLRIAQPIDEATIRNSQGYVPVIVEISPELKSGDKLQILYDGEPLGEPQATTVFALNDVKRGSHTIAVQAVDEEGNVLSTSEMITIFMHRPRVGMVPQTKPKNTAN
ncbi:hypothetical protein Lrub_0006 [Legionella rubrilucens]|uniref:DUF4124 domain-containing protein n=1 Tax=Legionella rubrilucens TaxID=458 RepID=A0A0W0Y6V8_9GAMM|nr:DUF4124 domain-containing protein [Legionella rubrilucens]KTD52374.1 hypothetical protein Lrub_0006 [Legionella rubrilucens]